MADKIDIKTPEDLNKVLSEVKAQASDAAAAVKAIEEQKLADSVAALTEAQEKAREDVEKLNKELLDKIGGLTLAFKARGTWKEQETPVAASYGIGKLVTRMAQAFQGSELAKRELAKREDLTPTYDRQEQGFESRPVEKMETFEKTSATISTAPVSGDDSGTYYGSYLIPVTYAAEVQRVAADASAMMSLVRHIPVRGITTYVPYSTDAMTFTKLTNQQTPKTEDTITFGRATLTVNTYAFWMAVTEEMDEDSLVGVGELVKDMAGEAWGLKFDDLALDDSTYGALALCSPEVVMDTGDAAYSSVNVDYLDLVIQELTTQTLRQGARFFFHTTVFDHIRNFKNANGDYIFQDAVQAAPATIRGYPFSLSDGMPPNSESSASDSFVLFGNPRHILAGDRVGFEFRIFDNVMGTMQYDQIYLRARVRQAMTLGLTSAMAKLTTAAS